MSTLAKLMTPSKESADLLTALMLDHHGRLLDLANKLRGGCSLDGEPARLEPPSPNSRRDLWVVRTVSGTHWAQFSTKIVELVLGRRGGAFRQQQVRKWATCL